jgi:hypothetical protein
MIIIIRENRRPLHTEVAVVVAAVDVEATTVTMTRQDRAVVVLATTVIMAILVIKYFEK